MKEVHVVIFIHMQANISCNGGKGVVNFIMGPCAFIAMGAM
jgi:hypothetical protein